MHTLRSPGKQGLEVSRCPSHQTDLPVNMCSKAVRQFGEVRNGHKFKRPPSKKCMARYRAIAAAWLQTYSQHQIEGTLPADMHGTPL